MAIFNPLSAGGFGLGGLGASLLNATNLAVPVTSVATTPGFIPNIAGIPGVTGVAPFGAFTGQAFPFAGNPFLSSLGVPFFSGLGLPATLFSSLQFAIPTTRALVTPGGF